MLGRQKWGPGPTLGLAWCLKCQQQLVCREKAVWQECPEHCTLRPKTLGSSHDYLLVWVPDNSLTLSCQSLIFDEREVVSFVV